jgi:hypothetical protein
MCCEDNWTGQIFCDALGSSAGVSPQLLGAEVKVLDRHTWNPLEILLSLQSTFETYINMCIKIKFYAYCKASTTSPQVHYILVVRGVEIINFAICCLGRWEHIRGPPVGDWLKRLIFTSHSVVLNSAVVIMKAAGEIGDGVVFSND